MDQSELAELKARRFRLIKRLYDLTNQNVHETVEISSLRTELNLTVQDTAGILDYLEGEDLLKFRGTQHVAITHKGIVEVETALEAPDQPTTYFPPASTINIINIGQMANSHIQQSTTGSYQLQTDFDLRDEAQAALLKALALLEERLLNTSQIADSERAEIFEVIKEARTEIEKQKPNRIRLTSILIGVATTIQTVADLKPAYEALKSGLLLIGVQLP